MEDGGLLAADVPGHVYSVQMEAELDEVEKGWLKGRFYLVGFNFVIQKQRSKGYKLSYLTRPTCVALAGAYYMPKKLKRIGLLLHSQCFTSLKERSISIPDGDPNHQDKLNGQHNTFWTQIRVL